MLELLLSTAAFCLCLLFAIEGTRSRRKSIRSAPLPPGPKTNHFGNVRDMPSSYEWIRFSEMIKDFGKIIYMRIHGKPVVVLNSFEHAQELMDKRGSNFSDRPRMVLIHELVKVNSPTFMPYGDRWRKQRRIIQQNFTPRSIIQYRPHQEYEIRILLEDLRREPRAFRNHIRRFIASVMLTTAYGYRLTQEEDPLMELIERTNKLILGPGLPGTTFVDHFPLLQYIPTWLPGGHIRRHAELAHQTAEEILNRPFEFVEQHRAAGDAIPSYTSSLLSQYEQKGEDDPVQLKRIKDAAGSLYRAGTDSTFTAVLTFMLAMSLNPYTAKKAQAELDSVVGRDRLPTLEDRDVLPYVECIYKETLRWHPPFPMGISHRSLEEDELEGKRIPEGSVIMPNIWRMMHDEIRYPNSESFRPERFEKVEGKTPSLDPSLAIFGFGRRICPGKHFADATVWLTIACILHAFDISSNSKEAEDPSYVVSRFYSGAISIPKPFECNITPRADAIGLSSTE